MKRIASLHVLRGLAAFMVVLGHTYWFPFDKAAQNFYLNQTLDQVVGGRLDSAFPLWIYLHGLGGHIPVLVFFLLSGFVLEGALKKLSAGEFVLNRILRIYPVFAICLGLSLAVMACAGAPLPSLGHILGNLTLTNNSSILVVSWTLLFEMRYYLYAGLFALLGFQGSLRAWVALALFALGIDDNFFWISFMAIGVVMYDFFMALHEGTSKERYAKFVSLVTFVVGWYVIALYVDKSNDGWRDETWMSISAILIFIVALSLYRVPVRMRFFNMLGDVSYPLYCVHYPIIVASYYTLAGKVSMKVIPLLAIGMSLVAAWILHRMVEKPAMGFSRKLATVRRQSIKVPSATSA